MFVKGKKVEGVEANEVFTPKGELLSTLVECLLFRQMFDIVEPCAAGQLIFSRRREYLTIKVNRMSKNSWRSRGNKEIWSAAPSW